MRSHIAFTVTPEDLVDLAERVDANEPTAFDEKTRQAPRYCAICGAPVVTGRRWCSTACHKADDPGAYEAAD